MSTVIRQSELRNDNAVVMRRVASGERFVVTVNGRPVADLVPHVAPSGRRRLVPVGELADALVGEDDPELWRRDLDDLAQLLDDDQPHDPFAAANP